MKSKPTAILTADWHLQETTPICRLDNFRETQRRKLQWISDLQKKHNCPVLHAGDLFDYWKPSPELLTFTIENLPKEFYTIYGNHDLPQHNLELLYKSGIKTLQTGKHLDVPVYGVHWGMEPLAPTFKNEELNTNILIWHVFTYHKELPFPGCVASNAKAILKKYSQYDLILTGDNHETFVEEFRGRLLVNPGSIFRLTTKQIEHKPSVFLYYAENNTVKQVFIPIEENVISRKHIEVQEQRDKRLNAFITGLIFDAWDAGLNFKENLKKYISINEIETPVVNKINKFLEL